MSLRQELYSAMVWWSPTSVLVYCVTLALGERDAGDRYTRPACWHQNSSVTPRASFLSRWPWSGLMHSITKLQQRNSWQSQLRRGYEPFMPNTIRFPSFLAIDNMNDIYDLSQKVENSVRTTVIHHQWTTVMTRCPSHSMSSKSKRIWLVIMPFLRPWL